MRHHTVNIFTLIIAAVLSLGLAQSTLAKGKPVNVEVIAADPRDAFQGETLPVTISGSGFDSESQVRYLVSGTIDDTQVIVDEVEYISPSELRTRIRVNGNATISDYDIEVQNSSGRKGKGTTLFRVKQVDVGCTGDEPKEPAIAFVGAAYTVDENLVSDLYLASESGCEETMIAEAVDVTNPDTHEAVRSVVWLRLSTNNGAGVLSWTDMGAVAGFRFEYDAVGNVLLQSAMPQVFYQPDVNREVWGADVRFSAANEAELVMREREIGGGNGQLIILNLDSDISETLISGDCPVLDPDGMCLKLTWPAFWGRSDEIYINLTAIESADPYGRDKRHAIARITRVEGVWGEPVLMVFNEGALKLESVSATGVLVLDYEEVQRSKNGRVRGLRRAFGAIHVSECESSLCSPLDGVDLAIDRDGKGYLVFTPDGRALVLDTVNRGQEAVIMEYSDPFAAGSSRILIEAVNYEFDTAR
jgi:hypothetical protein